jgi:hypothetical protein
LHDELLLAAVMAISDNFPPGLKPEEFLERKSPDGVDDAGPRE